MQLINSEEINYIINHDKLNNCQACCLNIDLFLRNGEINFIRKAFN